MPLIEDAVAHGELSLSMATACSGTDAPVVAMRVARELLAQRGIAFDFKHVMSCELEPYKQSFIARNNPGARGGTRAPPHTLAAAHTLAATRLHSIVRPRSNDARV